MVTAIEGRGTDEVTWSQLPTLATVDITSIGRPLVVAPHPDDEILGVGGLLALIGAADIVAVTDGEGSHPHTSRETIDDLALRRPLETEAALKALGGTYDVQRLGHPDGGIDEQRLTETLLGLLTPGRICLATWRHDGHPDHEAVGRAAAAACVATGARLWEYPIWMWHWATPQDPQVDWSAAYRIPLPPDAMAAKAEAVAAFVSQITPIEGVTILPDHVLARFRRPFEVVFG